MFRKLFQKKEKPILVCIHGFGKRRSAEFNALKNVLTEYDYIIPDLFDQSNDADLNMEDWLKKAENALLDATRLRRPIILIGFSMGGVIASHLASKIKVSKLILLAPAFEYLTLTTVGSVFNEVIRGNKDEDTSSFIPLPREFTTTFRAIVDTYNQDIYEVTCPILILHASEDEVISSSVSEKVYRKLENPHKKCIILQGGSHRLLDDEQLCTDILFLIESYILNKF